MQNAEIRGTNITRKIKGKFVKFVTKYSSKEHTFAWEYKQIHHHHVMQALYNIGFYVTDLGYINENNQFDSYLLSTDIEYLKQLKMSSLIEGMQNEKR